MVSAAAGGVGSLVSQLGKVAGCRVIGIAGGPTKCDWLMREVGIDDAVDYKADDFTKLRDGRTLAATRLPTSTCWRRSHR